MIFNPAPFFEWLRGPNTYASRNLECMQERLIAAGNARGALIVLSHRFPGEVSITEDLREQQDQIAAVAGAPLSLEAIQREQARGWRIWQARGLKGAVQRFLRSNPYWGKA